MSSDHWTERLAIYDESEARNPNFERKGKSMPFTSANGTMPSQTNKAGEIGIRLSKERQERFLEEHSATQFKAYGTVMKGYVLVPDHLLEDLDALSATLSDSFAYVMSLEPK